MSSRRPGTLLARAALALTTLLAVLLATVAEAERFSIVALPDTQNYAQDFPDVFHSQTQWVADNREALNIKLVTHLGDIVNRGSDLGQWAVARSAMSRLDDGDVPYGTAMGNHDNQYGYPPEVDNSCSDTETDIDCTGQNYLDNFGPQWFEDAPWYGGASASGLSNYQTFEAAGLDFLFLHLEVDPRLPEREWAQGVIDAHPDHLVHLTTHRYMYDYRITEPPILANLLGGGRFNAIVHGVGGQELYYRDAIPAENLYVELIAPNPNVFMVQCGHVDAELRMTTPNEAGQDVYQFLIDFQSFSPDGGNGWLRIVTFDIDEETGIGSIEGSTYSPWIGELRENGAGLDGSLQALNDGFADFRDELKQLGLDVDALEARLDFWTNTEEGRAEALESLYGDGSRDSEFAYEDVDFRAYLPVPEPRGPALHWAALLVLGTLSLVRSRA